MTDAKPAAGRRPLDGVRVLEMGQLIAGPFTTSVLGYFGAEVIKIEPPRAAIRCGCGARWLTTAHLFGGVQWRAIRSR